jgi:hypothetical protein
VEDAMKVLLIVLAAIAALLLLGVLRYLLMSKAQKIFFKQQLKALPHMLPRYFV